MSASSQNIWSNLNPRQQTYLQAVYQCDQEAEQSERSRFNRGQFSRPAHLWRWQQYAETRSGPTKLKRLILDAGFVDSGTGSTFQALEKRGLINCRSSGSAGSIGGVSSAQVDVQMTRLGRKVVRAGLGIQLPKKLPPGTLQDYQWEAFADCYEAGFWGLGLVDTSGSEYRSRASYGGHDWTVWLRLRDDKGGDLVEEYTRWVWKRYRDNPWINQAGDWTEGWRQESWIRLTPFGVHYYQDNWQRYRSLYPEIEAPQPQVLNFAKSEDPNITSTDLAVLLRDRRGNQGLRQIASDLSQQFGIEVHPSALSRVEVGKLPHLELLDVLRQWLKLKPEQIAHLQELIQNRN